MTISLARSRKASPAQTLDLQRHGATWQDYVALRDEQKQILGLWEVSNSNGDGIDTLR